MKLPRNAKIFRGQLDAAPFAGVAFLLLILLLLQSKFVFTPGVRIGLDLPEVSKDLPGTENPTVAVAIDRMGQIYYDSQDISLPNLRARLKALVQDSRLPLTLEVQADKAATWQATVPVLSLAREVGMREALLVTRTKPEPVFKAKAK